MTATAAQAAINALLRYNPRQPRDGDGRWTDGSPGGSADLTRTNVELSDGDRQFLSDYVEDGRSYREINDALRGQRELTREMADKVARLDGITADAQLDSDTTLYRAMSVKSTDRLMGDIIRGSGTITDPGYGSASGDRDAVEDFKGTTDNTVVFEIKARKGQPVLVLGDDLSDTAMMQTPQEVLLPRGYRLRIDKVSSRRRDGQMVWTVQATYEGADPQAITAAFNPHQRRGDDGKWIKMGGGGGPSVRAQRAARRGVRPTASDSVELPDQPPVKVAPRFGDYAEGWMREADPADRAARFWQGRFTDQRTIRQVFRNITAGADPLEGVDLDDPHLAPGYLHVTPDRPEGMDWDTWEEHSKTLPKFYTKEDLGNELVSAARWLHESLADAPVTTEPLYRGMRMNRSAIPEPGDTWEADVISWAEQRYEVERYAWMPEDPELGRVGDTEVVMRLRGPKRSVDLGPGLLNEHLTQGRYRVVSVTGRGRRRFITVEEVAE